MKFNGCKRFFTESPNDVIEKVSDGAEISKAFEFLSEEEQKGERRYFIRPVGF